MFNKTKKFVKINGEKILIGGSVIGLGVMACIVKKQSDEIGRLVSVAENYLQYRIKDMDREEGIKMLKNEIASQK